MNINRHNYESYFLLYIDKELSGAEMRAVEEFVKQNVDLKSELEQWQLSVLQEEECSYGNKEQLFKKETITAQEEANLILLLDGELSEEEAIHLKKTISSNKSLAKEWELLEQTKLVEEDDCIFENKELLYRKEEKVRPVYSMVRWAVAAALLGMGFYAGYKILNKQDASLGSAIAIENNTKPTQASPQNTITALNNKEDSLVNQAPNINQQNDQTKIAVADKARVNNVINVEKKDTEKYREQPTENYIKTREESPVLLASNNDNLKIKNLEPIDITPDLNAKLPAKRPELIDINIMETQTNRNALTTAFNNKSDNDRILYMDKEVVEKTKVGKFLKKVIPVSVQTILFLI
jgi:hypothetical protein